MRKKINWELQKLGLIFLVGFFVYPTIEVFWSAFRGSMVGIQNVDYYGLVGRSSIWMAFLGGFLLVTLGLFNEISLIEELPLILQFLIAGLCITLFEFTSGYFLCIWPFQSAVWCYDDLFLHFPSTNSVICLPMTLLWIAISGFIFWIDDALRKVLYQRGNFACSFNFPSPFFYYHQAWKEITKK